MYKLKNMVKRSTAFTAAVAMFAGIGAAAVPSVAFADALNPLTERSLTLSSSSPGWSYTDGSGNPDFAPAGSGPNGQKTGQTFSFRMSSDTTTTKIKAMTFQYCDSPAGICVAPGNITTPGSPTATESNLDVHFPSPVNGTNFIVYKAADSTSSNFATATIDTGWSMTTDRKVTTPTSDTENNFITLTKSAGMGVAAGTKLWVVFKGTDTNYITNPGATDAFFARLNTYSEDGATNGSTSADIDPLDPAAKIIDGGVTVANMMNRSIWITTKVLETMSFSVGTVNPDTQPVTHGTCDAITTNDQIQMGDADKENSLSTIHSFDAHSYWRLSTNSSAGASVYYSGATLNNTVGDEITPIHAGDGVAAKSHRGTEQFGLALDELESGSDLDGDAPDQTMDPLVAATPYANGAGLADEEDEADNEALFAFKTTSLTVPEPIASNGDTVTECATGKMRYIANIAPSTPAGVYTTKINYIASPQY